jgi:hypothetical protein
MPETSANDFTCSFSVPSPERYQTYKISYRTFIAAEIAKKTPRRFFGRAFIIHLSLVRLQSVFRLISVSSPRRHR